MLDRHLRPMIDRMLARSAQALAMRGVSANALTAAGLGAGLVAAVCIGFGAFALALGFGIVSRLFDGLDGAVARLTRPGPLGGYLDILADFTVYAALPLGFAAHAPGLNALPAAVLLASFFVNAASFLGYAILAEQHGQQTGVNGQKSHYHATGLIEGTETIAFFTLCLLWPAAFRWLAPAFAALTFWTVFRRSCIAWITFHTQAESPPVEKRLDASGGDI